MGLTIAKGTVPTLSSVVRLFAAQGFNFEVSCGAVDGSWRYSADMHGSPRAYVKLRHWPSVGKACAMLAGEGYAYMLLDNRLEVMCIVD